MSKHNAELSEAINKTIWSFNHGQYRYMNEFIRLNKSGSDMLHLGLFPDAKEVTESYGALNAVRTKLKQYDFNDPDITLVSVGDGTTPRTAALFAFRTKWNCISIDPLLKNCCDYEEKIQRLTCYDSKVEEIYPTLLDFERVVIVAVHSHASLQNILQHVKGKVRSLVAIPCCVPYVHSIKSIEWQDSGIWSPKNTLKVWRTI